MSQGRAATVTSLRHGHAMYLDALASTWHETMLCHILVEVPPAAAFSSVRYADIGTVPARALLWLRTLPARTLERLSGRSPPSLPSSLSQACGEASPWTVLAEAPDAEIVAGAIGSVWRPVIRWVDFEPSEFAQFCEPNCAKIATGISVRHYGAHRSLLSMEVRATATDHRARDRLHLSWQACRPFIRLVVRGIIRSIKVDAEQRGPLATQPI